jgi:hypothetical protein
MLAFWCGGDTEQMDRLFRKSGLMRDKWERDDYRASTLNRAVNSCTSFYKPVRVSSPADDFNDIYGQLQSFDLLNNPRYRFGDIGFGRLFADVYRDICRFVPERKKWYVFQDKCWQADVGSLKAMELCKSLADSLLQYALTIREEHLSTSFFIPKPFTPFQWERQISIEEMKAKQALLADGLSDRRISYRWHDFESSVIEAVLARGDRRLSSVIEHAWRAGAYLDAWHEHFDPDIWADALSLIPGGAEFYTRERDEDELFPWEHLDFGVTRHFFERERKLSREGRVSLSCFDGCSGCGCDLWQTGICLPSSKFKSGAEEGE